MTRNRIAHLAKKYMDYDMIALHTELPPYPDGRIKLLHAMLSHQPVHPPHRELFPLVTSLVQMGLDTHDLVENAGEGGTVAMRARQLKVLAGDYFSSRFYHLLAQAGQIDMVRRLSEAVCEVNRIKMSLYVKMQQMKLTAEEFIEHGAELKSGLFLSFTPLLSGLHGRLWPELVDRFGRCELLLQELTRAREARKLHGSWGYWHVLQIGSEEERRALAGRVEDGALRPLLDKYEVEGKLIGMLKATTAQLAGLLPKLQSDKLTRELQPLIEPFIHASGPLTAPAMQELG